MALDKFITRILKEGGGGSPGLTVIAWKLNTLTQALYEGWYPPGLITHSWIHLVHWAMQGVYDGQEGVINLIAVERQVE